MYELKMFEVFPDPNQLQLISVPITRTFGFIFIGLLNKGFNEYRSVFGQF